jgi:universal stress protein E
MKEAAMKLTKILFATDLGSGSRQSLARLQQLATAYEAEVVLVHVTSGWQAFITSGLAQRQAEERLGNWAAELGQANIRAETRVYRGNAVDVVLEVAELERSDLIMVGAGDIWCKHHRLGSTAHAIGVNAAHPVWIDAGCSEGPVRRIVCGVDGSEPSRAALDVARGLSRRLRAELIVAGGLVGPHSTPLGASQEEIEQAHGTYREERIAELEAFLATADVGPDVQRHFAWGRGSDMLKALVQDCTADLIVIGRTGSSLLRRVPLGGTAVRLLRDPPCAILLAGAEAEGTQRFGR